MVFNKNLKWGLGLFLVAFLVVLYKSYNPVDHLYFPRCPFLVITGYQCPGCGSQRAVHHLLNLEVGQAMSQNILLVFAIPYILIGFVTDNLKQPTERVLVWRRRLYGLRAIFIILILIIAFWILRNTTIWP